jgi:F-type H+-transporting ATPase subunit delta
MISSAILGRYARSLADIVFEKNLEPQVTGDLNNYSEIFRAVPDLLEVFHSPAMPRDAKERILNEILARYPVNPITSNFLRILLRHHRIRYFPQIMDTYLKVVSERKGVLSAVVTTAAPLSQKDIGPLAERLAAVTGKRMNVESRTDAGLLGGVVVQVGSTVYDGSIRTMLAEVKRRLSDN